MENKKWTIYKHTSPSGKSYIGLTFRKPEKRWQNGCGYDIRTKMGQAIQKYGWDNFSHEIIEENIETLELAKEREQYWIDYYDSFRNGYNSTIGGDSVSLNRKTNLPVYQLDANLNIIQEYPTLAEAARALEISPSGIMEAVRPDGQQISAGGFYWCLVENYSPDWKPRLDNHKQAVVCVETGRVFDSETDAANSVGVSQAAISACCYGTIITCAGKHWAFASNYGPDWTPRKPLKTGPKDTKEVVCVETGEIFSSISDAAKKIGISRSCISRACKENHRTAKNYHFIYRKELEL